jgi:glycosyltransferase involved in cell wall biosynthesis
MVAQKPKILYFYVKRSTFIGRDIEMLSERFHVEEHQFDVSKKYKLPLAFAKQKLFLFRHQTTAIATVTHIAGYASYLPTLWTKVFKLPSLVIIAGTDGAKFPAIRYGNFNRRLMGWFTRMSYRMASHLAPVDESLVDVEYTYDPVGAPRQGYRHFCPDVTTPHTVVHYGYDAEMWPLKEHVRPPVSFVTVIAGIDSQAIFLRKGVDLILEAARLVPEATFTLVGANTDNPWLQQLSPNVHLHPVTDRTGLVELLNKHRFYLQLSLMEGFPNALCEAMLCGCIPIGSNVAAIPFIIGDTGYVLGKKDPATLAHLIRQAMIDRKLTAEASRQAIADRFPASRRLDALTSLLGQIVQNSGQPGRK